MSHPFQGYIFTYKSPSTGLDVFALAVHSEQERKFAEAGKVLVRLFNDELLQTPLKDDKGQPLRVLKSKDKLTFIGFND